MKEIGKLRENATDKIKKLSNYIESTFMGVD